MYSGNGATTTFAISPGHNSHSVLVFLNGVCQRPTIDYTVTANAVDFSIGTTPQTGTTATSSQQETGQSYTPPDNNNSGGGGSSGANGGGSGYSGY